MTQPRAELERSAQPIGDRHGNGRPEKGSSQATCAAQSPAYIPAPPVPKVLDSVSTYALSHVMSATDPGNGETVIRPSPSPHGVCGQLGGSDSQQVAVETHQQMVKRDHC